jgi:plasmid stabilization system protein ParE
VTWAPKALKDMANLLAYIAKDAPGSSRRFGQKLDSEDID